MNIDIDFDCISFGAGVNSVAMAVAAIEDGWRGRLVFADTGCEWPETMCYIRYFERDYLRPHGLSVVVLNARAERGWDRRASGKTLIEYCEDRLLIPLAARRWCTRYWKVLPLQQWQEHNIPGGRVALGIAADEAHRQPDLLRPLQATILNVMPITVCERGIDVPWF